MATASQVLERVVDAAADTVRWAWEVLASVQDQFGARRRARLEAELDRKQDELRATILSLAEAIGMEAHEARKALIRESFLASGRVPKD